MRRKGLWNERIKNDGNIDIDIEDLMMTRNDQDINIDTTDGRGIDDTVLVVHEDLIKNDIQNENTIEIDNMIPINRDGEITGKEMIVLVENTRNVVMIEKEVHTNEKDVAIKLY